MRVVIYDPYQPDGIEKALGVERCGRLDDLLRRSEFLSLHCPLTAETRHLVNARTLALLPRGAYVVNTARGPCVDLGALADALDSGQVRAAGLDVVEREPLDDERIRRHPGVVLTPHAAFYSVEGFDEMRTKGAEEARRLVLGEPVRNPVNCHCLIDPRAVLPPPNPMGAPRPRMGRGAVSGETIASARHRNCRERGTHSVVTPGGGPARCLLSLLAMIAACPDCLSPRTHPEPYRWYETPLVLVLVQPYRCRRCGRRFLRPRTPDRPGPLLRGRSLVLR
jgi:hypothetical protein